MYCVKLYDSIYIKVIIYCLRHTVVGGVSDPPDEMHSIRGCNDPQIIMH